MLVFVYLCVIGRRGTGKGKGGGKGSEKNAVERWINVCIAYGVHFLPLYLFLLPFFMINSMVDRLGVGD